MFQTGRNINLSDVGASTSRQVYGDLPGGSPGGHLYDYDPLVITRGTVPAADPPLPQTPAGSVVTIDVGFNGNVLRVAGRGGRHFVQGLPGSPFGQVSFANGPAFFAAAKAEDVTVPALDTSPVDGMPCPTVHDFSLVDQDPSDNVTSEYVLTAHGVGRAEPGGPVSTPPAPAPSQPWVPWTPWGQAEPGVPGYESGTSGF